MNLSSLNPNKITLDTLEKGLSFIPTRKTLPISNIITNQNKLIRSIKLRYHFRNNNNENNKDNFKKLFVEKKNWTPNDLLLNEEMIKTVNDIKSKTNEIINKFQLGHKNNRLVTDPNVTNYTKQPRTNGPTISEDTLIKLNEKPNLDRYDLNSISELKNNKDIIIKQADKGGATVIMDRDLYVKEAERQLFNTKYYRKLDKLINENNVSKIHNILTDMYRDKFISKDQLNYLSGPTDYKTRTFYLLPKVHKKREAWPQPNMPEGRPIVSDINSETYRVSEFIDYFINPLAMKHFTYIKNSYEFVNKIRNKSINDNYLLVTGDVSALYTNMHINRTIDCVKKAFRNNKDDKRPDDQIIKLLEISLNNNDFEFDGKYYLQILGTAMGKRFAPALANLYLLEFDEQAANGFPIKPLFFLRYLDDIFFIWPGDVESLKQYELYLNSLIPDIKITLEYSTKEISFLDTLIYKHNNTLQTRTYFKPTDTHQLLHTESFHPRHTFNGLLKSQLIRFKRLSSTKNDYDGTCRTLFSFLINRGYTHSCMRKLQHDIWHNYIDRLIENTNESTISNNVTKATTTTSNNKPTMLPIIIDYCKAGTELAKEYKAILTQNSFTTNFKLVTAYTNSKNIKQLIVRSKLVNETVMAEDVGAFIGCAQPRCITCKLHASGKSQFCNEHNKTKYNIKDTIYCHSKNLIYLITCDKCKKQYVGETGRTLRDRLNDHRSAIKNKQKTPIAVHFNQPGHSVLCLRITPIELVKTNLSNPVTARHNRERYWQQKLKTLYPLGINNTPTN